MQIRKSTEADFEAILAIYNLAIPTKQITADLTFATKENRRAWFDFHLTSEKYPIWTVEDETGVAGWLVFLLFMSAQHLHQLQKSASIWLKRLKVKAMVLKLLNLCKQKCLTMASIL